MKLKEYYKQNCVEELQKQFNYENVHEIPKVAKVVVNRGLGEVAKNSKAMEISIKEFETVTGQKPIVTFAKKSVCSRGQHYKTLKTRTNHDFGLALRKIPYFV